MTLTLTPEVIEYAKNEVKVETHFEASDIVIAQHILYNMFLENTKWKGLPKLIFYILLNQTYGLPHLKDADGYLGYALKIINPHQP